MASNKTRKQEQPYRKYLVTALEKFTVVTEYVVMAKSKDEAERKCKGGLVPYVSHEFTGDDEWLETQNIEEE